MTPDARIVSLCADYNIINYISKYSVVWAAEFFIKKAPRLWSKNTFAERYLFDLMELVLQSF